MKLEIEIKLEYQDNLFLRHNDYYLTHDVNDEIRLRLFHGVNKSPVKELLVARSE